MDRFLFLLMLDFLDFTYFYINLHCMSKTKKINIRKNQFKTFTFKLSLRQFNSLKKFSELEGSTPLKVIKDRIYDCIEEYSDEQIGKDEIAKNQLDLFKPIHPEEYQLKMFDK